MTKIIHVIVSLEVGGAEGMLKRLVLECSKNPSIRQSIITLKNEGTIGHQLRKQGVDVISLGMTSFFSTPLLFYRLIRIFSFERPDVVYTWMYHSDLLGGLAAFLGGARNIIWGIRNTSITQRSFSVTSAVIKICSILSFYIPKKIVCCAEAARLAHIELGYCAKKIVVIPNGYDLSLFNPSTKIGLTTRIEMGISESALVVGVVGRFDPLKDFNNFVQAASRVCDALNNVKFVMVGRGLDHANLELKNWIRKTGHADKFYLVSEQNPHNFLAAMDVFCLSSKSEGFPNVVAEAMAMQVPCVVTDVGDASIIVSNSGTVVEPMNAAALAEGLIKMLSLEPHERKELGYMGRGFIKKNYEIEKVSKHFLNLTQTFEG